VSWINIAEVYYITKRRSLEADPQLAADKVVELLEQLPIQIEPVSKREAVAAARLKSDYVMSLADAFAAALAKTYDSRLVTGDPEFEPLDQNKEVSILWLPAKPKRR
jgi:predicted nucleic acid-binding protein